MFSVPHSCTDAPFSQRRLSVRPATGKSGAFEVSMKTQWEIEAAICQGMSRFEYESVFSLRQAMGRVSLRVGQYVADVGA